MLVLFRPNGVTSFMRTAYPDLMPVSNHNNPPVLKPKVAVSCPDTPLLLFLMHGIQVWLPPLSFHCIQYLPSYDSRRLDDPIREVRRGFAYHTLNSSALLTG